MPRKDRMEQERQVSHKILVNIGDTRHEWLTRVGSLTQASQTELMKMLIDEAMIQDVENFAMKVDKAKAKAKLEDLDRRERALQAERAALLTSMQAGKTQEKVAHR